jgi:hypothetical protein
MTGNLGNNCWNEWRFRKSMYWNEKILDSRIPVIPGDSRNPCIGMSENLTIGILESLEILEIH